MIEVSKLICIGSEALELISDEVIVSQCEENAPSFGEVCIHPKSRVRRFAILDAANQTIVRHIRSRKRWPEKAFVLVQLTNPSRIETFVAGQPHVVNCNTREVREPVQVNTEIDSSIDQPNRSRLQGTWKIRVRNICRAFDHDAQQYEYLLCMLKIQMFLKANAIPGFITCREDSTPDWERCLSCKDLAKLVDLLDPRYMDVPPELLVNGAATRE